MIHPPFLQTGDKIAIVATARKITPEEVQPAIDIFKSHGLEVVLGENLFAIDNQFAGTDDQRRADLQAAMNDDTIKAIVCARGGYGTVRIIDGLDFVKFKLSPKWLAGYSDVTALHSHIQTNFGIQTLHSTMPLSFPTKASETDKLQSATAMVTALMGQPIVYHLPDHPLNRPGKAEGIITGGNLSMLYSLLGSPSDIDTDGKVLFLEDLDEYLYHIDRMMMNLKRNGKLDNLAALLIGGMSDMNDNKVPFGQTAEEIIAEKVAEYTYPVYFNFPAGHIEPNLPIKLGGNVKIDFNTFAAD